MAKIGLSQAEIVDILSEGIVNGQFADAEATKEAIAKAIIKNNEAIERQVTELVSSNFVKGLGNMGLR